MTEAEMVVAMPQAKEPQDAPDTGGDGTQNHPQASRTHSQADTLASDTPAARGYLSAALSQAWGSDRAATGQHMSSTAFGSAVLSFPPLLLYLHSGEGELCLRVSGMFPRKR